MPKETRRFAVSSDQEGRKERRKEGRKAVVCICVFLGSFVCFCWPILFLLAAVVFSSCRDGGREWYRTD